MNVVRELMFVASELLPRIRIVYKRGKDVEEKVLNEIQTEIQRLVSTIRRNEELECFLTRMDNDKEMRLTIGFTDHEQMKGIEAGVEKLAKKLGRKKKVNVVILPTAGNNLVVGSSQKGW